MSTPAPPPPAGARPDLRPLAGLRFSPQADPLGTLVAPPYDVISPAARAELAARSRHNIVRLELPEERPGEGRTESFIRAAGELRRWRDDGILGRDPEPAVYLHHHHFEWQGARVRRGLFVLVGLDDERAVRPHERTMAGPRAERLELLSQLRTQVSPVLAMFRSRASLPEPSGRPDAEGDTGTEQHRLWRLTGAAAAAALAAVEGPVYIADGHHRFATAQAYRDRARERAGPGWTGNEPENFVLMGLAPVEGLLVLPIHRLVAAASVPADLDARLARLFAVEQLGGVQADAALGRLHAAAAAEGGNAFALLGPGAGRGRLLRPRPEAVAPLLAGEGSAARRQLDVAVLEATLLGAVLGVGPAEVASGAIAYSHDAGEAARRVASGEAGLAVLMEPTPAEAVLAVADQGELMPQKSTFFYPKLPAGLVLHAFD